MRVTWDSDNHKILIKIRLTKTFQLVNEVIKGITARLIGTRKCRSVAKDKENFQKYHAGVPMRQHKAKIGTVS